MKSIFKLLSVSIILFSTLLSGQSANAQLYGHEWIKPNNQYYKFKINTDNIYRITKSKLDELGFGNVPGSNFAIFREGKEIPIYVTTNGVLGANDYIEFAGFKADGKMDTALFVNPTDKANLRLNILDDNAYYFLTHDISTHERLTLTNNPIPTNPIIPTHYYKEKFISQPPAQIYYGPSISNSETYYSSNFKKATGRAYSAIWQTTNVQHSIYHYYPNSPFNSRIKLTIHNTSNSSTNNVKISVGNEVVLDSMIAPNALFTIDKQLNTILSSNISTINFIQNGKIILIDASIYFPSNTRFSFDTRYEVFKIKSGDTYFNLTNIGFPQGSSGIVKVIDLHSKSIYQSAINASTSRVQFSLNNSSIDRDIIVCTDWSIATITNFTPFTPNNFYNDEGNYIILSNNNLINAVPNYINQYKNYRNSFEGGSNSSIVVSTEDIYNHFGYGYEFNALSIKNFIKYTLDNWKTKPEYLFIIGKGIHYVDLRSYLANPTTFASVPIPTWGYPGSDNLLSSFTPNGKNMPELATGRLSVTSNDEINIYLTKVKEYEAASSSKESIDESLWKKNVLHVAGAGNLNLQNSLIAGLNNARSVISDTFINANVHTIYKRDTDPISSIVDNNIDSLINNGLRYITFYGHASSSGFDYNLNTPDLQNSKPRYPIFMAYGCDVATIFSRNENKTISERYLLAPNGGSIAMIASNNLGWTNVLPSYMLNLYKQFSFLNYESTLGKQYLSNIKYLNTTFANNEYFDVHTQSFLLQGDPGLQLNNPTLPDYAIESKYVSTHPATITSDQPSFKVNAKIYNIGKGTKDSVWVRIKQIQNANNVTYADSVYITINLQDSVVFNVPLFSNKSIGLNKYEIEIDPQHEITELFKSNNKTSIEIYINSEDLVPIYPYNYSIVSQENITLKASTLNPFASTRNYILEIDTTKLFNSNIKQTQKVTSQGGVINWTPTIQYQDSTVYYWRTCADTVINGSLNWNYFSFIYIQNGNPGWNQSHYYQYLEDSLNGLSFVNRKFEFSPIEYQYESYNVPIYTGTINNQRDISDVFNGSLLNAASCWSGSSIQIGIFDSTSALPLAKTVPCSRQLVQSMNEFVINTIAGRNNARDFIQNIPPGYYVTIKNLIWNSSFQPILNPQSWKADSVANNSNNTLYNTLVDLGFTEIENIAPNVPRTFIFFTKKGDATYTPQQVISQGTERISMNLTLISKPDTGTLTSTIIGPAKKWESMHWKQTSVSNAQNDSSNVKVFGISSNNSEILLHQGYTRDTLLSFIDAVQYPNIKLVWQSVDNINRTSADLNYWRVHYTPQPEAALNKIKLFSFKDTLGFGENLNLRLAIENLSEYDMDSMLVRYRLIDNNNVTHDLGSKRYRALPAGDTISTVFDADLRSYTGENTLFIEANPNKDQPEQYHPNNIGYLPLFIGKDNRNPLLDVTFDGVRILDKDLVSGKPLIKILLNDDNKYLLLNDTALFEVMLASPSGSNQVSSPVKIPIDGTICKFYPALPGVSQNEAYIEFRPTLEMDGIYKLIVKAKDNSNNKAGNFDSYEVNFMVENKSSITHLLNYPNPFSTSTAFVFTLTGNQIPSQFKIQIISVTGKVVREITKEELGPIHIGRNITEYKWDGKDQYGQLLGNGVYLYRVITHTNGENIEHRSNTSVDKYFKNGYGKMYIMR